MGVLFFQIPMQGRCEVCGADDVEVRQTKTEDGQLKTHLTNVHKMLKCVTN